VRPRHPLAPPPVHRLPKPIAAAIRTAFEQDGELLAAIELRRLLPGITTTLARTRPREAKETRFEHVQPSGDDPLNRVRREHLAVGFDLRQIRVGPKPPSAVPPPAPR